MLRLENISKYLYLYKILIINPMKVFNSGLILIFALVLASCSEDDPLSTKGDYFPLQNLNWSFQRTIGNAIEFHDFGTITLRNTGTVLTDGKLYTHVTTGDEDYIVLEARREGSEYFERNGLFKNDREYKFLDTEKGVGESWSYIVDPYRKVEYTVQSKNALQEVNGTVYRNVITMKVDYYTPGDTGAFEFWLSAEHVYVEGIGEVYSFVPYPASLVYGDVKSVRIHKD